MIALENMPRNKAILLTFYASGFRVAELCSLKWSDLQSRDKAGQITVFGKGAKTRTVLDTSRTVWNSLQALRGDANENAPGVQEPQEREVIWTNRRFGES